MRANYEQLVKAHQRAPQVQEDLVPDEVKFQVVFRESAIVFMWWWFLFQVFQIFMDSLFQSFNQQVSMNNFAELSGCVFSWIEEQCKPSDLQDLMYAILRQTVKKDEMLVRGVNEPMDPAYQRNWAFWSSEVSHNVTIKCNWAEFVPFLWGRPKVLLCAKDLLLDCSKAVKCKFIFQNRSNLWLEGQQSIQCTSKILFYYFEILIE